MNSTSSPIETSHPAYAATSMPSSPNKHDFEAQPGRLRSSTFGSNFPTSKTPSSLSARLSHFTWAWFTLPMATGGLALLLHPDTQPHTFDGLLTIGKIVLIWDLFLFTLTTCCITYRFISNPGTLHASLTHPTESLFASTSLIAVASILACIARYGIPECGPWLTTTFRVLFWVYCGLTWLVAIAAYITLFTNPTLRIQDMTPAWDLPIFPVMLLGTLAAVGAPTQSPQHAVPMIIAGLLAQGLGFLVSMAMYASYVRRMVQFGFPGAQGRPGMFIAVGPPSFTALAIIGMANGWPIEHYNYSGGDPEMARMVMRVLALVTAVFIWSLSFWFFCIALVSVLMAAREMSFHLNWYAFVFPNVGFTVAIISMGNELQSEGVMWVGSVLSILLVVVYLFVLGMCARAVVKGDVMLEGKDEDVYYRVRRMKSEKRERNGESNREIEKED